MADNDSSEFITEGGLDVDIEGTVLDIMRAGEGSSEDPGLRPLRELIQNADDVRSDRVAIRIDSKQLTFWNDGLTLTKDTDEMYGGTFVAIRWIQGRSRKDDKKTSGNFGSGFRSCHMFADEAEILGRVRTPSGESKVVAVCKPHTREVDYNPEQYVEVESRSQDERPERKIDAGPVSERKGVRFRFPWRTSVTRDEGDLEWERYLWDKKRISELADNFVREVPRILLGCRWIREAVLCIDIAGSAETHLWERDFNIEELIRAPDVTTQFVTLRYLHSDKAYEGEALLTLSPEELQPTSKDVFMILSHKAGASDARFAKEAGHEPYCMLITPFSPADELPAYTPIALTGDSGNAFGPLAFLPPHNSRTKIKLDFTSSSIGAAHVSWTAAALSIFCDKLLPKQLSICMDLAENDKFPNFGYVQLLQLLPRRRPDYWFSDVSLADHSGDMVRSWERYTRLVSESPIIPSGDSVVKPEDTVLIDDFEEGEQELIAKIVKSLGLTVIDDTTKAILESLEGWAHNNPINQAERVDSPQTLKRLVQGSGVQLKVSDLGEDAVRQLIRTVISKTSQKWADDDNRERIPVIPDADGILRPLKEDDGSHYFFDHVDDLPDLLPNARTIHPDYVNELEGVKLGVVNPSKLAEFVDESVGSDPDRFRQLQDDDSLWLQISKAAVRIVTADEFKLNAVKDYRFLPCLHRGKVSVRDVSRVGDKVWGVDVSAGGAWFNYSRKEFIFHDSAEEREGVGLHPKVIYNLTWLELHPDIEEEKEDMKDSLLMHSVGQEGLLVNIFRSLIFGHNWQSKKRSKEGKPGWGKDAVSLFHKHEDGEFEIDRWLEQMPSDKERDEILESLLDLLPKDTEDEKAKLSSSSWGAHSKTDLPKLHLLKGADGEWHKLGDLCYELDPGLSELFKKTPVLKEHKEMLSYTVLTRGIDDGGLGITTRIREEEIIDRLTSLRGFTPDNRETRNSILGMMLDSHEEWVLEDLGAMDWVPRKDGETVIPSAAIMPTTEMKALLGGQHPWYIDADADLSSEEVRKRAADIGLIHDHEDPDSLLEALLSPEEVWEGLTGISIIESLTKAWKDNKDKASNSHTRRNRLPNSEGEWSDGSWLCDREESAAISSLFPEHNVSDRDSLGSKASEDMARVWIVRDPVSGPRIGELLTRIARETGESELQQLWDLVVARKDLIEDSDIPADANAFLVPIAQGSTVRVGDVVFSGPKSKDAAASESISSLTVLTSKHPMKDVLVRLGALDLESVDHNELLRLSRESMDSQHSVSQLERLWLALAMVELGDEDLLRGPYWPCQSREMYGVEAAIPRSERFRKALFPMRSDEEENIRRIIHDGLPMFLLPREGPLMERIYQRLESNKEGEVPFLSRCSRRQVESGEAEQTHPYLKEAISNIVKAIGKLGLKTVPIKKVEVNSTNEPISGVLEASLGYGSRWVVWKGDTYPPNVDASVEEGILRVLVSTYRQNDRSEGDLVKALTEALKTRGLRTKDVNTISELIRTEEEKWGEIDEVLSGITPNHERPLIEQALYATIRADLGVLYDCCQFCKRQTPKNRSGEFQEGVVQIFSNWGAYSTRRVPYELGNSLYLCPVHKGLHHSSLMQIQEIDEAVEKIRRNPSAKDEAVEKMLSGSGSIAWNVTTYERPSGEGKMRDVTNEVVWKGKHAAALRRTVAFYLEGL